LDYLGFFYLNGKYMKVVYLACIAGLFSLNCVAGQPMSNQVLGAGVNSNGHVFVNFKDPLTEPGCNGRANA
jgi:hypothetical protein